MKAGKGHAFTEERQVKQGMRARQSMKMKKSKEAGAWTSNSCICIQAHAESGDYRAKAKNRVSALMPTEEYLFWSIFFGASNSHHTHYARATRTNCASPHKQAKQANQHVARNSFWCHFCAAKTTFGAFLFAAGQANSLGSSLPTNEPRRTEAGPHHERTGTYAEN